MRITRLIGVISGNGVLLAKLFGAIGFLSGSTQNVIWPTQPDLY
jgi:hypothetical protein